MKLDFRQIAAMAGGSLVSGGEIVVERVVIDSREVDENSLFVAILGERLDGHQFLSQALETARGAIVDRMPDPLPADRGIVIVDDTTAGLQRLATAVRRKVGAEVVGLTGSAGKTTTKEMLKALIATEKRTFSTWGNFNNHIGLPLCLANTPEDTEVVIAEMGMSGPGEIAALAAIAEPSVAVYTNVKPVHIEFFDSIEGIAAAKKELIDGLKDTGTAVLNADDHRVLAMRDGFGGRVLTYGIDNTDADLVANNVELNGLLGTKFDLVTEGETVSLELSLPGRFNLQNLLAAIGGARVTGISWDGIREGIAAIRPASHRGEIVEWRGATLYDDTYNSNPHALASALDLLVSADCSGRRVAVIGDMLELGRNEKQYHFDAGNEAPSAIDAIVAVGTLSRSVLEGASAAGFASENLFHFSDAGSAADFLEGYLEQGDLVLLKGSRGVGLDRVISRLKGNG